MQSIAERHEEPTAIRTNLGAIFVSLELSRSIWLITSVSPGGGEKMSKHSVPAGDTAALLTRFSELDKKAFAQTGKSGLSGIVCGAIVTPMEGAYGNQERHPGRFAGGA